MRGNEWSKAAEKLSKSCRKAVEKLSKSCRKGGVGGGRGASKPYPIAPEGNFGSTLTILDFGHMGHRYLIEP